MSYTKVKIFKNYLQDIQGKTEIYLNKLFIDKIKKELQDKEVNENNLRDILKKHRADFYCEFIPSILRQMNSKVVELEEEEERKICELFKQVCNNYSILFPNKDFFPYHYILYRLLEYINHPDKSLLSPKRRIYEQHMVYDKRWDKIKSDLDWTII